MTRPTFLTIMRSLYALGAALALWSLVECWYGRQWWGVAFAAVSLVACLFEMVQGDRKLLALEYGYEQEQGHEQEQIKQEIEKVRN